MSIYVLPALQLTFGEYLCVFQLIFRKVSDVKREKELAERRKNEPAPELGQDHLVRKLFSRFKKSSENQVGNRSVGSGSFRSGARRLVKTGSVS